MYGPPKKLFEDHLEKLRRDQIKVIKEQAATEKRVAGFGQATRDAYSSINKTQAKASSKQKPEIHGPPRWIFEQRRSETLQMERRQREALSQQVAERRIGLAASKAGMGDDEINHLKKQARYYHNNSKELQRLNIQIREYAHSAKKAIKATEEQNIATKGLTDSTRNLIRSYVSVFAVMAAAKSINKVGQDFEAMNSAMLAATGTKKAAAEEIEFLDKMTSRLGMSLLDTSDAYTKFLFAGQGKLSTSETRELFEGLSELGTTLGISKERMKLSMTAIQQMMNKGTVTSEELKRQLAESLPGAIQIFSRATGLGEAEMFKMMEQGKLLAADVLPKVGREMKKVAAVGLAEKLETTRVAQGRFLNEMQKAQNKIFKGGFDQGLAGLFNSMSEQISISDEALKGLGETFKLVFNAIRQVSEVLIPVLNGLFLVIGYISKALNVIMESDVPKFMLMLGAMALGINGVTTAVWGLIAAVSALAATTIGGALVAILRRFPLAVAAEEAAKTLAGNPDTTPNTLLKEMTGSDRPTLGTDIIKFMMTRDLIHLFPNKIGDQQSTTTTVEVMIDGVKQSINQATQQQWQASYNSGV